MTKMKLQEKKMFYQDLYAVAEAQALLPGKDE